MLNQSSGPVRRLQRDLVRRSLLIRARLWIARHPWEAARLRSERAWLFGADVGRAYLDNSAALHQYVRRERPNLPAYWIIDSDSPDVERVRRQGPVLFRDSLEAHVRGLLAAVHIISHGAHDVPSCSSDLSRRAVKVRLGHGLTALKLTRPRAGHTNESANAVFDLVTVASALERDFKLKWDIAPERLEITGLPRFDALLDSARHVPTEPKRILYMPTWREKPHRTVLEAELASLLGSKRLLALLKRHDAALDIFLHRNLGSALPRQLAFFAEGTRISFPELLDPQPLLARAGLLITDYSSVAWDMLYLDKPMIFFQPDEPLFAKSRGSYLPPEEFPGPVVQNQDALAGCLEQYFVSGLDGHWSETMRKAQARAFAFRDDQNCRRVVEAIDMLLQSRDGERRS